ncbi:hypothetical protein HK101_006533, partial [Irineochytrium annulatum]
MYLLILSAAIFIGYHGALVATFLARPASTVIGVTRQARCYWVQVVMRSGNTILGASVGIFSYVGQQNRTAPNCSGSESDDAECPVPVPFFTDLMQSAYGWKLIILVTSFMCSFFCFTQSLRLFNHTGILIAIQFNKPPSTDSNPATTPLPYSHPHHPGSSPSLTSRAPPNVDRHQGLASPASSLRSEE